MSNEPIQVTLYSDFDSILPLKEDWNILLGESPMPNIFLTWEWITIWWSRFGKGRSLHFLVAQAGLKVVGVFPLYLDRMSIFPGFRAKTLRFVGDGGPVFPDYLGPIIKEDYVEKVIDEFSRFLHDQSFNWNMMRFSDVYPEISSIKRLVESNRRQFGKELYEGEERCPYLPLPSSYENLIAGLHSRRRESVRRVLRKAQKKYDIKFECYISEDSVDEVFSLLVGIYKNSIRGQDKHNGFNRDDYLEFHREIAKAFAKKGWLRLYILWLNDSPTAFIYGYLYKNSFWYYQTGYDKGFSNDAPGSIVLQKVFESVIGEGAEEFDFLKGDEDYKFYYSTRERRTKTINYFRKRGLIYSLAITRHILSRIMAKVKN